MAWRKDAASKLSPGLTAYEIAIRPNIGLRLQPRFGEDQAVEMASCLSTPRDLTLRF